MGLALVFLMLFSSDPIKNDSVENKSVVSMDVTLEVVSGSQLTDHLTQNVKAKSRDNSYHIGFKEFVITYPSETEIITGENRNKCSVEMDCSSYSVTNIEKVDDYTGKVRIHYLVGESKKSNSNTSNSSRPTATIIYL